MTKTKTSISLDKEVWTTFLLYCLEKHGSTRKASEELQAAILWYMKNNPVLKQGSPS
ncbi:MAG: hypothetical protein JRN68_05245 [Nitrososphaerota archaeon]|nr:hypothetical protein [Nitrososphaerota archaeon]